MLSNLSDNFKVNFYTACSKRTNFWLSSKLFKPFLKVQARFCSFQQAKDHT